MVGKQRLAIRRYSIGARAYDIASFEWPVYGAGRRIGIDHLGLQKGMAVLDVGCGSGLNFAPVIERIGPSGKIVGIDKSQEMLAVAQRKVDDNNWPVELIYADAAELLHRVEPTSFDAVLFTYVLSIVPSWHEAISQGVNALKEDGRVAIVDMALPHGRARLFSLAARFVCWTGGADINRHPWTAIPHDLRVFEDEIRGGHIHVVVGKKQ